MFPVRETLTFRVQRTDEEFRAELLFFRQTLDSDWFIKPEWSSSLALD